MITYDYTIDRKLGEDKSRQFIPDKISTKLNNMVLIEGPNSSGKSTLLNILALGLYGTRNTRINQKLQNKMNALIKSDYQKLRFSFSISSEDGSLIITSEKKDLEGNEIILKEGTGDNKLRIISPENFEKKYNLIYDIPDNPTERLQELLKELKEDQQQFGNRIKDFYFFLDKTISQINSTRDPKILDDVKNKLMNVCKQKKELDKELPELQKFLDFLEKRAYIQYYCYYSSEGQKLEREKQILEKSIKYFDASGKKITSRLIKDKSKITTLQRNFKNIYDQVTPLIASILPKSERSRFTIWKEINPYQTENDDSNTVRFEATHYIDIFGKEIEKMKNDQSFKEASIWEKIFQSLKEFENSGLVIPQLELSLGKFVKILKFESKKSFALVQRYQILTQLVELLDALKNDVKDLQTVQKELKQESNTREQISENAIEAVSEQKNELEKMEDDLEVLATKCNEYLQRCLSKGVDEKKLEDESYLDLVNDIPINDQLEEYLSLGEICVMDKIEDLKSEIIDKRGEMSGYEMFITQYTNEIKKLEKQKPHRFEPYIEELNLLLRKTDEMRQKLLFEFSTNLKYLMDGKVSKNDIIKDISKSKYYEEVSKYLAYRVGSFRHIDKIYKAKIVDLIDKIIITNDDENIHMIDMGTGQEQSTYILSVLNIDAKSDPRKIIALFDEIAMMDDKSLEPICSRMRELKKENRLLIGILVQKGNQINIRNLG